MLDTECTLLRCACGGQEPNARSASELAPLGVTPTSGPPAPASVPEPPPAGGACVGAAPPSSKYSTEAASAASGAVSTPTITLTTMPAPEPADSAMASMM